jgi:hypothetical protein
MSEDDWSQHGAIRQRFLGLALAACSLIVAAPLVPATSASAQQAHGKRPAPSSADSLLVPPPATATGCATFDVEVDQSSQVTVTSVPTPGCGPITPVIAGGPTFESADRIIHIPIALYNGGVDQLHAPASVVARAIEGGPQPQYLGVSVRRDSTNAGETLARWSYDTLLRNCNAPPVTAADGSTVLPATATSEARSIDLHLAPGVTGTRVALTGSGTYLLTVAARPPDSVSAEEMHDSRSADNVIGGDPRFPGRVVRNKLWLLFRRGATAEQREAAVEAINGQVVGGAIVGVGNHYPPPSGPHLLRYYYVAFPAYPDSGAAPLERAIRTLAPLAQVQDVHADVLDQK